MITLIQATAILSILMAFGVDPITVSHVHDILIPQVASTTQAVIVPVKVVQTPLTPSAPIYFGSTAPVMQTSPQPTQTTTTPVVACDDTPVITTTGFTLDNANVPTVVSPLSIPQYKYLYFAVVAKSQCTDSHWTIKEEMGGKVIMEGRPSDDASISDYDFVRHFNGQLYARYEMEGQTIPITFIATDGVTTGTTTVQVAVTK